MIALLSDKTHGFEVMGFVAEDFSQRARKKDSMVISMPICRGAVKRKAFTLIELLVVIAIISLLASILIPSLQRAKELARQVICLTRLKSIGTTLPLYQAEFDGLGPVGYTDGDSITWKDRRKGIFAEEEYPNPYDAEDAIHGVIGWFTKKQDCNRFTSYYGGGLCWGLAEYLDRKGTSVFTDGGPSESPVTCPNGVASTKGGTQAGYAVNYFLGADTFLGNYANSPANNPMLMDGSFDGVNKNWNEYTLPNLVPWPNWDVYDPSDFYLCTTVVHMNSGNFLFFDGHAENHVTPKEYEGGEPEDIDGCRLYYKDLWDWRGDG